MILIAMLVQNEVLCLILLLDLKDAELNLVMRDQHFICVETKAMQENKTKEVMQENKNLR